MRWDYDPDHRDWFSQGVHRDILIVPHATKVTPVAGQPPIITNKRPVFEYVKNSTYPDGMWIPKKQNGQFILDDVDWVIDNSILIKEKFKYSYSLNSDDNLTFSGCNAAMVQFTIRNKKEYIEEEDENGNGTGNWYWENEIPNLQNYEFVKKASDGTEKEIIGELEGNYIIKVYTYINGDSSTMVCLGMFRVEEDKVVGNGYERQITAYDFMATFRDMDIYYWYKHLFDGINMATNDYEEFTKSDRTKDIDTTDETAIKNWVREPQTEWTIGDALKNLINNLASFDMIVWEDKLDDKGNPVYDDQGNVVKICKNGMTVNNPSEYGRDYVEGAEYSGYGMPVVIDPDILTDGNEPYTPEEPGENEFERYGYMKILELPFQADPSIIKKESLSMGKFLEDIGRLAGRYPFIRADYFDEHDYEDPTSSTGENVNAYNNYERCILSFKPLPSSKDDSKLKNIPEMSLSNHEIMKGFEHETYVVDDIEIVTAKFNDKTDISYHRLSKDQRIALQNGGVGLQTYTFSDNLFCSYLISKSDDEEIKKKLDRYKEIKKLLFGKEYKSKNMTADALFYQGYGNMRHRSYRPYKLTTYADPCRDVGDRIQITFEDKITGEKTSFCSYILERSMEGIQKMMDTYEAKGDISNPIFSNYQTGAKYQSSSSFQVQSLGYNPTGTGGASGSEAAGISPSDLVQYWRNFGIRLLDEPSGCSALFSGSSVVNAGGEIIQYNYIPFDDGNPQHQSNGTGTYIDKGYFDEDPTRTTISIFGIYWDDDLDYWNKTDYITYIPKDFDLLEEFKGDYIHEDWGVCATWVYYQGRWYQVEDCNPDIGQDEYHYVNIIADEGGRTSPNNDYIKEGISSSFIGDNGESCSTYDVITINGVETQVHFGDGVINLCAGEPPIVYMPPGIWKYPNFCGTDGYDSITLAENYHYNFIGDTKTSLIDGSTQQTIIIRYSQNTSGSVTAQEYDQVRYLYNNPGSTKYFIFFDGTWHDIESNLNNIITISNNPDPSDIDPYPELKEIIVVEGSLGPMVSPNQLIGIDLNKITINGTTRNIQPFDLISFTYLNEYYIYTPSNVWTSYNIYGQQGLIGCEEFTVPVRQGVDTTKKNVQLKWSDPPDITDYKPTPATWEGTVIVRKENQPPLHRWDGEKVVRTTERDKYKTKPYKDEDIRANKVYYYGFFPYYTKISDPNHPIRFYTFTKVIRVETGVITYAPVIESITVDGTDATITYSIIAPEGVTYSSIKLYGKIGSDPACDNTDDIVEDVDRNETSIVVLIDITITQTYYFCIRCIDNNDTEVDSNIESIATEGPNPDPDYEALYSQINVWNIIHTPNWSIVVPDVWVAPTQNDYTGRYFVWDSNDRLNHSYYRANAEPGQWSICSTNQDVYSLENVITINIDKNSNNKYVVTLPTLTWSNDVFKNSYQYPGTKYYGWRMDYNGSTIRAVGWYTSSAPSVSAPSPFNTLYDALYWTVAKFKHFNLFVDGTLWVLAS